MFNKIYWYGKNNQEFIILMDFIHVASDFY